MFIIFEVGGIELAVMKKTTQDLTQKIIKDFNLKDKFRHMQTRQKEDASGVYDIYQIVFEEII